jgi:ligand-binding SRPBCC domain-containing protein
MIRFHFRSELAAPAGEVWAKVSTMAGVNHELHPWVHMTVPASFSSLSLQEATPDQLKGVLFHSVLLGLCCIPFDVHALHLDQVQVGQGFDEHSTSWMQKTWIHRRRVIPAAKGCVVTDELVVEPRVFFMAPVVRAVIGFLFRHRHCRLVQTFGSMPV